MCHKSGWVQTVLFCDLGSNCLLKANVMASQRMSTHHEAWVGVAKSTGAVVSGHCSCMAGLVLIIFNVDINCCHLLTLGVVKFALMWQLYYSRSKPVFA